MHISNAMISKTILVMHCDVFIEFYLLV